MRVKWVCGPPMGRTLYIERKVEILGRMMG